MRKRFAPVALFTVLGFLLVSGVGPLSAQDADDRLTVHAGVTYFNNPEFDSLVLVEFPFTINRHEFDFFPSGGADSGYSARIFSQVNLYGVDGLPVDSANTYFAAAVPTLTEARAEGYKLFNKLSLLIKPGIYSARMTVVDVVSKREGDFFLDKIVVEPARKNALAIGGVCLAYRISYLGDSGAVAGSRMLKNGFNVLSNPLGIYGVSDTLVYLYAELYNLAYPSGDDSQYRLACAFLDDSGKVYRDFGYRTRQKSGNSAVIAESFDITGWTAGLYRLRLAATDLLSGQADTQFVAFRIVSMYESLGAVASTEASEAYDTLSLEVKLHLVEYLLTPAEKKTLNSLSDTGKETFAEQFWREYEPDPDVNTVQTRQELLGRYLYCNAFFSSNVEKTDGWLSDRGRIYMTYGPWEERDDIQTPTAGNPFEVWYYYSIREGGVFVFEDKQGFHDYTLVHSNVEGERYNQGWEDRLREELYKIR